MSAAIARAAGIALLVLLAACGGGGSGGVDVGGTGVAAQSYAVGPIEGFGSVVVGGVHYDETGARIEDGDGNLLSAADLALGMVVEIESGPVDDSGTVPTARALVIRTGSELVGRVDAVEGDGSVLRLLGQRVLLDADTVVDARLAGGGAGIAPGRVLEVHALYDAAAVAYRATRVAPAAAGTGYRLRGPVAGVDAATRTFTLGGATVSYADAGAAPAGLADGGYVRVRLDPAPDAGGRWRAIGFGTSRAPPADRDRAQLRGLVDRSGDGTLRVDGVTVDVRGVPSASLLVPGNRVEVRGVLRGGVLVASEVRLDGSGGGGGGDAGRRYELAGSVASLDTAARSFVVRGVTVLYGGPGVRFSGGTAADLADGRWVEVRGRLSEDRSRLVAEEVRLR